MTVVPAARVGAGAVTAAWAPLTVLDAGRSARPGTVGVTLANEMVGENEREAAGMGEGSRDRFAWAQSCCAFSSDAVWWTGVGRYTNKPTPIPAKSTNPPRLRITLNLTTLVA